MKGFPRPSIALRLGLAAGALVAAAAVLSLYLIYAMSVSSNREELDDRVHEELGELTTHYEQHRSDGVSLEIARRTRDRYGEQFMYLFLAVGSRPAEGVSSDWPAEFDGAGGARRFSMRSGPGSLPREMRGEAAMLPGGDRLLVAEDLTQQIGFERDLRSMLIGVGVLCVFFALAAGISVGQGLLARVKRMNRTIVRILEGRSDERVPSAGRDDEFEELVQHFNALLDEKDRLVEQVRGVTRDISHDLRTPLTRLRNRLELAITGERDPERDAEVLGRTLEDTDGILETFDALLSIAQMESGALNARMEPVSLDSIARDAAELYEPVAEEAGSRIELILSPVEVRGERHLLAQAVTNLLDNAIKYAAGAGPIEVRVAPTPDGGELVIADHGAGIPSESRERVLERFVRLDASRGRPGTGLGLSFVAAVAGSHGARLELDDNAPGLIVKIRFPASKPSAS